MRTELGDDEAAEAKKLITGLGLTPNVVKETLANVKLTRELVGIIKESGLEGGCEKEQGALVMIVASTFPSAALAHRPFLMSYITAKKIITNDQCSAAIKFLKNLKDAALVLEEFEKASGVGVVITDEQIEAAVGQIMRQNEDVIKQERYHFNFMKLLQPIKATGDMVWADIKKLKDEIEKQSVAMLGPKTAEDEKPREKPKKVKQPKQPKAPAAKSEAEDDSWRKQDPFAFLPAPGDNTGVHEELTWSSGDVLRFRNSNDTLNAHLAATGGEVVTRFPPEPNGYLHIGHSKAMFIDFGMAQRRGGKCILRFDDTNPEAEKGEYIAHIKEIVKWMGWEYCKITYSSDYFDQLHGFAVQLIKAGKAYVCHQTADEIKECREQRKASPWRDRPVVESLRLFEDMRRCGASGLVEEKTATLRLRMDPSNDNRNMDDLVAYRVKFCPHPHVGSKWCIYPSYDFTHCIVDALENITHSLCTLEFHGRRPSYYWLLQQLGLYMPVVWEYSRLNLTNHVMSKRKLQLLVNEKIVRGWDDPRLPTLAGMRRRGFTPEGINTLCQEIGINRSEGFVQLKRLYHHVRNHLDATSPRALAVLHPLKLVIDNLPENHFEEVQALKFPGRSQEGYMVPFTKVCFIEASDFREKDSKDFYGLAPGKRVMLRYARVVKYVSHDMDSCGRVTAVHVECELDSQVKPPKGVLSWVGQPSPGKEPVSAELFNSENPAECEDWKADILSDSEQVLKGIYISNHIAGSQPMDRFQFERLGYFCVDTDSKTGALVFNRTCSLRDTYADRR